jgi:hypothetical protein
MHVPNKVSPPSLVLMRSRLIALHSTAQISKRSHGGVTRVQPGEALTGMRSHGGVACVTQSSPTAMWYCGAVQCLGTLGDGAAVVRGSEKRRAALRQLGGAVTAAHRLPPPLGGGSDFSSAICIVQYSSTSTRAKLSTTGGCSLLLQPSFELGWVHSRPHFRPFGNAP